VSQFGASVAWRVSLSSPARFNRSNLEWVKFSELYEKPHVTVGDMCAGQKSIPPKVAGISLTSVQRIWKTHGLAPHRIKTFKLSNDPKFAAKVRDIVGLYVDPPAHAVVLSVDEKSQIQALDRTQPGLPMKKGRA